jgi:hypothetical protein
MINNELVSYIKVLQSKQTPLDVIEKNLLGAGWTQADISEALAFISKTNTSTVPVVPPSVGAPSVKSPHHHSTLIAVIAIGIILIAGGAYAYMAGLIPFSSSAAYSEQNLFSGILEKSSSINTSSYSFSGSLDVVPREAGAKPFVMTSPEDETLKNKYRNDVTRSTDLQGILGALRYNLSSTSYPATLQNIKNNGYGYANFSTTDPATAKAYSYTSIDGGKDFALKVTFETQEAISQIRDSYNFDATKTKIEGKTVTFTKDSSANLYFSSNVPKPLLLELTDMAKSLPNQFKVDGTISARTNWQVDTISDWAFNLDANGDFGDLQYKFNIDALKKAKDYFFKVNNMPSIFLGSFSDVKGVWIKISPDEEGEDNSGGFNIFSSITDEFIENEQSYKENRAETTKLLNMAAKFADEEKLFSFKNEPKKESLDGRVVYRYELQFNKGSILPFYQKLLNEASQTKNFKSVFEDSGFLEYLQGKEFEAIFDYYQENTSITLWTDEEGFLAGMEYIIRLVPPDEAEHLKDKQVYITITAKVSDINKPITIEAPADAKNIKDIGGGSLFGLEEARNKGANAAIKANLSSMRAQAELYYDSNHNSYGKSSLTGKCDVAGTLFADPNMVRMIASIKEQLKTETGSAMVCYSSPTAWAASASLKETDTIDDFWCVDSTGVSKAVVKQASSTVCP